MLVSEVFTKVHRSAPLSISRLRAPFLAPFDSWTGKNKQPHCQNFGTVNRTGQIMTTETQMPTMRTESDAFGPIEVDSSRLWGAQVNSRCLRILCAILDF